MSISQKTLLHQKKYFDDLLKRRFILAPSFDIYGGVAGLYDFGPVGCAIKNNLETFWREHFILEESMLEVNTTCLTPSKVLKASGHVDRFADLMIKDVKNGNVYRADKYLQEWIESQLENKKTSTTIKEELKLVQIQSEQYSKQELHAIFQKYEIKSKDNNPFSEPEEFNLMFASQIGPTGHIPGFLRPETAQGIFVNFGKLLEFNNGKLPFAGACMGLGFRNEIAPRAGLLRVREFQMAEIEHFVDPLDKSHSKFHTVQDLKLPLFSGEAQVNQTEVRKDITLKDAVDCQLIDNQTLAYFMGRTFLFLTAIGVNDKCLRFRQHMKNEMAHYAQDCWDAEIETSYGWIECVGIADRSAYDLNAHMKHANVNLYASRLIEPTIKSFTIINLNKQLLGKTFKQDQEKVLNFIDEMTEEQKAIFKIEFESNQTYSFKFDDKNYTLSKEMVTKIETIQKTVQEEKFVPSVIEPSFGVGRVMYALLEHSFKMRDEKRTYLSLKPKIAPVKCSILTVQNSSEFVPVINDISNKFYAGTALTKKGISCKVDDGNQSIGKRYARTDEIGIPFGITVDKDTLNDNSVTLREIESTRQIRVPLLELVDLVCNLISGNVQFLDLIESRQYQEFSLKE